MTITQPYPFRTNGFLSFPDLSFRARRNDAGVAHQRPAAFLDLLVNLVEDGFGRRSRLFVLLLRERSGSLLEVIAGFTHQLTFRFRRWERCADGGTECNAQSGQNERLIAAKVEHVPARRSGAGRESVHSLRCPAGGLRNAPVDRGGGPSKGGPRLAGTGPCLLVGRGRRRTGSFAPLRRGFERRILGGRSDGTGRLGGSVRGFRDAVARF